MSLRPCMKSLSLWELDSCSLQNHAGLKSPLVKRGLFLLSLLKTCHSSVWTGLVVESRMRRRRKPVPSCWLQTLQDTLQLLLANSGLSRMVLVRTAFTQQGWVTFQDKGVFYSLFYIIFYFSLSSVNFSRCLWATVRLRPVTSNRREELWCPTWRCTLTSVSSARQFFLETRPQKESSCDISAPTSPRDQTWWSLCPAELRLGQCPNGHQMLTVFCLKWMLIVFLIKNRLNLSKHSSQIHQNYLCG